MYIYVHRDEWGMWSAVQAYFKEHPTRLKVARLILELGLRVDKNEEIYCGPVKIPSIRIARACEIDRRVVNTTVKMILANSKLREVFTNIRPSGPFFRDIAKHFGFGVIEITADPKTVGIIAKVTTLIADEGIGIRQIVADDPELYPEPKLTVITEKEVPGKIIPKFLKVRGVKSVSVY